MTPSILLPEINRARRRSPHRADASLRDLVRAVRGVDLPCAPPAFEIMSPATRALYLRDGEMLANPDEGDPVIAGTTSSTDVDLYGSRMCPSAVGSMLADCRRGLTTFLNHHYEIPESILGSVRMAATASRRSPDDGRVYTDLDIVTGVVGADVNPRALQCWRAVRQRTKLGFSIGAYVLDWEWQLPDGTPLQTDTDDYFAMLCPPTADAILSILDVLLLESSLVAIPANRRSWVTDAATGIEHAAVAAADPGDDAAGRWDAWRTVRKCSWFGTALAQEDPQVVRFIDHLLDGQPYGDLNSHGRDQLALRVYDLIAAA